MCRSSPGSSPSRVIAVWTSCVTSMYFLSACSFCVREMHPTASSDFCAGPHATDLYWLRLLSLGLTQRDQVVPDSDAVQPAHLRCRGHAVRYDSAHTWASVGDAGDWLGRAGALRRVHPQPLGRHQAVPSARGELSCSLLVAHHEQGAA